MTLSIITINYNNRDGLQKTIDSVLAQTWTDFEWIVIDGGSTDGSRELIEQYQENFAYWCSEPDKGVYNAMNKGIAKAKGEYLNFMNSGDTYYEAETLQKVFSEKRTADILYGDCVMDNKGEKSIIHYPDEMEFFYLYEKMICHQAMFLRHSLLKSNGYDESLRICADKQHLLLSALRGATFECTGCIVCIYDMSGISSVHDKSFSKEWNQACMVVPYSLRKTMNHLNKYAGTRHIVRSRLLLEKGGLVGIITKIFLALSDRLFLNTKFSRYPYCD